MVDPKGRRRVRTGVVSWGRAGKYSGRKEGGKEGLEAWWTGGELKNGRYQQAFPHRGRW